MKQYAIHLTALVASLSLLSLAGCSQEELEWRNAQMSNGIIYQGTANKPFSGSIKHMPEKNIGMSYGWNDMLVAYNKSMNSIKAANQTWIGQPWVCDVNAKEGKLSGPATCYSSYSNSKRYEAIFKDGALTGDVSIYSEDGKTILLKGEMNQGALDGKLEIYSPKTGKIIGQYNMTDKKIDGSQETFDELTGNVIYQAQAKNGKYIGDVKTFSAEGKVTSVISYVNGLKEGTARQWDTASGRLLIEANYHLGLLEGERTEWNPDGSLFTHSLYAGNAMVKELPLDNKTNDSDTAVTMVTKMVASNSAEQCSDAWIAAFHKEAGEDAMISSDQLGEWEVWCQEGKMP